MEPIIADSARGHKVPDDDILHAFRNPIQINYHDEGFTMTIGPDFAGNPLEIGYILEDDFVVIIHAMKARATNMR